MADTTGKKTRATAPNMLKDEIAELLDIFGDSDTKKGKALRKALSKFISEQTETHKPTTNKRMYTHYINTTLDQNVDFRLSYTPPYSTSEKREKMEKNTVETSGDKISQGS